MKDFRRKKDFLICIDSDGCAMDTMDIKHFRCFGPCMVEEWGLEDQEEKLLFRWNQINLYSMTRGINRFKALALMLKEINDSGTPIEDVDVLVKWADEADELSNSAIGKEAAEKTGSIVLKKALHWSESVNQTRYLRVRKRRNRSREQRMQSHGLTSVRISRSFLLQIWMRLWKSGKNTEFFLMWMWFWRRMQGPKRLVLKSC